jgi:uncharacterized membrane protein YhhN
VVPLFLLITGSIIIELTGVQHPVKWFIIAGMVLSMTADYLITRPQTFIHALVLFLVSHIFYTICFLTAGAQLNLLIILMMSVIAAGFILFFSLKMKTEFRKTMIVPVTVYILVLSFMSAAAAGYDLARGHFPGINAAAAVCYLISDSLIAVYTFVSQREWLQAPVFLFYYAAQILFFSSLFLL